MNNLAENKKVNKIIQNHMTSMRNCLKDMSISKFVVNTLENLMLMEREEFLERLRDKGEKDKSNGFYSRMFKTYNSEEGKIKIPRTRSMDFKPLSLELLEAQEEKLNEMVLVMYKKGLTCRDIQHILDDFFDQKMSPSKISSLAEHFHTMRKAWEASLLEDEYLTVFCDAIFITLKRNNSYSKEAVHIIYGVREDCKREVLYLSVNPTESASSWAEGFNNLKERGVKKIDLIVADGLPNLEDEVHKYFPNTHFQKCVVHKMRGSLNKVRPKEKDEFANDLKHVFDNFDNDSTIEKAMKKLEIFREKWRKSYPHIVRNFDSETSKSLEYYFTYIKFPCKHRKLIYTTNSIENLNKKIRKATKNKQSFEKEDRLLDYIFAIVKDFEDQNWMKYPVSIFKDWALQTQ